MAMRIQTPCCHTLKASEQFMRFLSDTGDISTPTRLEAKCPECSTLFYMEIGVVAPKVEAPVAPVEQKKTKGK